MQKISDKGILRPGFLTSPATYVIKIQPSNVQRTETIANPKGPTNSVKD